MRKGSATERAPAVLCWGGLNVTLARCVANKAVRSGRRREKRSCIRLRGIRKKKVPRVGYLTAFHLATKAQPGTSQAPVVQHRTGREEVECRRLLAVKLGATVTTPIQSFDSSCHVRRA